MFRLLLTTILLSFIGFYPLLTGQSGLVSHYTLDDCTFRDIRSGNDGSSFGANECDCGVTSEAYVFDGTLQTAVLDTAITEVLSGDWTISLYVRMQYQGTDNVDLLFLGNECGLDSVLSLRYLPNSQRYRFILNDSPNNEIMVDGIADDNSCWQYIAITKEGAIARMYINGVLEEEDNSTSNLSLNVGGQLRISNSPCQLRSVNPDVKFEGLIDELKIFNRALTPREIAGDNLQPDKIRTRDTTVFLGNSIRLQTGGTCSSDFSWSPSTYLNDPALLSPISTPEEDITYTLTIDGGDCQSIDQVNIRVADQSLVGCEDLLLPSAFTPNGDGNNDSYGISNQFLINGLESFEIFNRWGGRVFFSADQTGTWDGMYNGKEAAAGSYAYRIVYLCEGNRFNKAGIVNLLR